MGHSLELGFGVGGRLVANCSVSALGVAVSDGMSAFQARFFQAGEASAIQQFGFEPIPKGPSVGIVVAVAAPTHAGPGAVAGK